MITPAPASNFGFWLKKEIAPILGGSTGLNLVSLPARNPYQGKFGVIQLCSALGLSPSAEITQIDPNSGNIGAATCSNSAPQLRLLEGVGVLIESQTSASGLLVGADVPGKFLTIFGLGSGHKGQNLFPVDYHTTMVTPEDLCNACGLSSAATVTRFDAASGNVGTHQCGQTPQWHLQRGEAVLILEPQGTRTCSPPHL